MVAELRWLTVRKKTMFQCSGFGWADFGECWFGLLVDLVEVGCCGPGGPVLEFEVMLLGSTELDLVEGELSEFCHCRHCCLLQPAH